MKIRIWANIHDVLMVLDGMKAERCGLAFYGFSDHMYGSRSYKHYCDFEVDLSLFNVEPTENNHEYRVSPK